MGGIAKQLVSPEWWFTVVFIGLIIAVVGPFVNEWVRSLVARTSGAWADRQLRHEQKLSQHASKLAADQRLLNIFLFDTTIQFIATSFVLLASWILPLLSHVDAVVPVPNPTYPVLLITLAACLLMYDATGKVRIVRKVRVLIEAQAESVDKAAPGP